MVFPLVLASAIAIMLIVVVVAGVPQVTASFVNYFNFSPLKFVDPLETQITVKDGEQGYLQVNIENYVENKFDNISLKVIIFNFEGLDTKIIREIPVDSLNKQGARTGNILIEMPVFSLGSGESKTFAGVIQLFNGDKKLTAEKPFSILLVR